MVLTTPLKNAPQNFTLILIKIGPNFKFRKFSKVYSTNPQAAMFNSIEISDFDTNPLIFMDYGVRSSIQID